MIQAKVEKRLSRKPNHLNKPIKNQLPFSSRYETENHKKNQSFKPFYAE